MEAFDRLIRAGKVRAIGASNLKVWRIAEANTVAGAHGWTRYSAVEQRHTYLRPRHGADFGPQVCINDDLKDYCRSRDITLIAYSALLQGAYTRADRPVPAQYAGPDSRCAPRSPQERGQGSGRHLEPGGHRMDAAERSPQCCRLSPAVSPASSLKTSGLSKSASPPIRSGDWMRPEIRTSNKRGFGN